MSRFASRRLWCIAASAAPFVAFLLTSEWHGLAVVRYTQPESLAVLNPPWWPEWPGGLDALEAGFVPGWCGVAVGVLTVVVGGWVCKRPLPMILAGLWACLGSFLVMGWYIVVTF